MRALIVLMMMAGTAAAEEQEAINAVGFRLATTYHCAAVLGDDEPYQRAKRAAQETLSNAGVRKPTAEEMIAAVESQKPDTASFNDDLCRMLLATIGD